MNRALQARLAEVRRTHASEMAHLAALGPTAAARFGFLKAGADRVYIDEDGVERRSGVGVNRLHCRPLHPHGKRLVDDGLMRLVREGNRTSRHTALIITDEGLAELERLRRKLKKVARRHA